MTKSEIVDLVKAFSLSLLTIGAFVCIMIMNQGCDNIEHRQRINCEYQGGVIIHKYGFKKAKIDNECYSIQYKGQVYSYVSVYDIDSGYEVGDTINKPCLTN